MALRELLGVSCTPPKSREECCSFLSGDFSISFCMAVCVLCCMTCTITFKEVEPEAPDDGGGIITSPPARPVIERPYPNYTPGPRGLSFTRSQYGLDIPIVFGSDKLDGNCFWSGDPVDAYVTVKGEKFYYTSVSFALGFCEGEINGLLRLWVGEKLIIDNSANVDNNGVIIPRDDGFLLGGSVDLTDRDSPLRNLKSKLRTTRVTVFSGSETQLPDGAMTDVEGYTNVPGYRGLAFILFENFITADGSLPSIFAEITSNTQTLFPRVYGDYDSGDDTALNRATSNGVIYDLSYENIHVASQFNSSTTKGIATFDARNLSSLDHAVLEPGGTINNPVYLQTQLLNSGLLVIPSTSGNQGIISTFNPFTGGVIDTMGPAGSLLGHSASGFGALGAGSCIVNLVLPNSGPLDCFFGIGVDNNSWGIASIKETGQIEMVTFANGVFVGKFNRSEVIVSGEAFAKIKPKYRDNYPTPGTQVFVIGSPNASAAVTTEFKVYRLALEVPDNASTVAAFNYVFDTINCDDLGGTGFVHTLKKFFLDPVDNCLVILFSVDSRDDLIVKYSPFTGGLLWKSPVTSWPSGDYQSAPISYVGARTFCWLDSADRISSINLDNGITEVLEESISAQDLPSSLGQQFFYHGREDSITYVSNTAERRIVKVFLRRITRQTVDLSTIVSNLLQRVGLSKTDINIQSLTALTMYGYTIDTKSSLRTIFQELAQVFKYDVVESNGKILYKTRGAASTATIPHEALALTGESGWLEETQDNDFVRTRKINLSYRDLDREYATNIQTISLPKYGVEKFDNDSAIDVTVPVVLQATDAKKLAEILLYAKITYNSTFTLNLGAQYTNLDPADVVTVERNSGGETVLLRLRDINTGADQTLQVAATQEDRDIYNDTVNLFGDIGRYEKGEIPPTPARVDPVLLMIPGRSYEEIGETVNSFFVFAAFLNNRTNTVLGQAITITVNGVTRFTVEPPATYPTWGYVETPLLPIINYSSTDRVSSLTVRMKSVSGAILGSAPSAVDVLNSPYMNLAWVNNELIQYQTATDNGNGTWTFTNIVRGKMGTEQWVASHRNGEKFILLGDNTGLADTAATTRIDIPATGSPRMAIQVLLNNNNPFQPDFVEFYITSNLRPRAVGGFVRKYVGSDAFFRWSRRDRFDGDLQTYNWSTVPLNELDEVYEMYLFTDQATFNMFDPTKYLRKIENLTASTFTYTAAMQAADGFDRTTDPLYSLVYMLGRNADSDAGAAIQILLPPIGV